MRNTWLLLLALLLGCLPKAAILPRDSSIELSSRLKNGCLTVDPLGATIQFPPREEEFLRLFPDRAHITSESVSIALKLHQDSYQLLDELMHRVISKRLCAFDIELSVISRCRGYFGTFSPEEVLSVLQSKGIPVFNRFSVNSFELQRSTYRTWQVWSFTYEPKGGDGDRALFRATLYCRQDRNGTALLEFVCLDSDLSASMCQEDVERIVDSYSWQHSQ